MSQPPPLEETRVYLFAFTGNAKEYFRIWIVNLFLSIVTIGIYSPWAKVRKRRYFCGNTWVADANFEYHGNPVAILKGRIVAVLALVLYNLAGHFLPRLGTVILIALMVAAPWLIVRSLQFNAVNSSYRNLRFHFHGRYREGLSAIAPLILSPLIALLLPFEPGQVPKGNDIWLLLLPSVPILLFYPYIVARIKRFQVARSAYGSAPFEFVAGVGKFYRLYFVAMVILVVGSIGAGIFAVGLALIPVVGWLAIPFFYVLVSAVFFAYTRTRVANLTFNSTSLSQRVRFASTLKARKLGWMYFENLLCIILTLGLMVPWAVMRTAQYRASCLRLECGGDLEGFLGDVARPVAATGDQLGEFFDVDLSL
jgi:uncharacterized membrane protein YjgN (DUF898 family)